MPEPIRVALLTARMSPAAGGLSVSVPGLAFGLDIFDDLEMHVLGTQDPDDPDAAHSWGPRVQALPVAVPAALQRAPSMARALAELHPAVVDVQGLWTWASKVNLDHHRRTQTPYIITPRGMLDPWARANSAWKKRLFAAFAETEHLRRAVVLRATAEMEAQHFRDMGLTNAIAVVPNGIEFPDLAPRGKRPLRSVLFLSRIHPKKGVDYLLRSWADLAAHFSDWELVIAGIDERGFAAELKILARDLALPRVRFIGAVLGSAKQQLYRDSDLFVLPSHAENFGLVVAEALAQETPVITTTNAPWGGLHDHGCGWWINLDQELLTQTMRHAMSIAPGDLASMGRRGREWVRRDFGMQVVASPMRDVYLWVAGKGAKPGCIHD